MAIDANRRSFTHDIVENFEDEMLPRARYLTNLTSCLESAARKSKLVNQTRDMDDLDELITSLLDVQSLVGQPYELGSYQCRITDIREGTVCHVCESNTAKLYDDDPYKICVSCIADHHLLEIERKENGR